MRKSVIKIISIICIISLCAGFADAFENYGYSSDYIIKVEDDKFDNGYPRYHYEDEYGNIIDPEDRVISNKTSARKKAGISLPDYYSSVDEGYGVPVQHQGSSQICWAFSSLTAVGVYNRKYYDVSYDNSDYSEIHLNYFKNIMPADESDPLYGDGESGGYDLSADYLRTGQSVLVRGTGLVHESEHPFTTDTSIEIDESERYSNDCGLVTSAEVITLYSEDNLALVKNELIEHGALQATLYFDYTRYLNKNNYSYFSSKTRPGNTNHAITIVGYDDNYEVSNFNSANRPEIKGAWLCQNSWGENWGNNGYFWVSYDENLTEITSFEAVQSGKYSKIYQYEGYNSFENVTHKETGTKTVACIHTAESDSHISAFNIFTYSECNIDVYLYKNLTDISNPESGNETYIGKYVCPNEGYHIFDFGKCIKLSKNENFSLVIKMSPADGSSDFLYPATDKGITQYNTVNPKQSFLKINNVWKDSYDCNLGDVPIKIYATTVDTKYENMTFSSCEETGEYDYVIFCNECQSNISSEHYYKSSAGHVCSKLNLTYIEPTCEETGSVAYVGPCDYCGEIQYQDQQEIPPLGHLTGSVVYDWNESEEPITCSAYSKCNRCLKTFDVEDGNVELISSLPATCVDYGKKTYQATFVNEQYVTQTKEINDISNPPLGHDFKNYIYNNDATSDKNGTETAKCERCSVTDTREKENTTLGKLTLKILKTGAEKEYYEYNSTIIFTAESNRDVDIEWYSGTEYIGTGKTVTLNKVKNSTTVYCKAEDESGKTITSENVVKIKVNSSFFRRLSSFFTLLFNKNKFTYNW